MKNASITGELLLDSEYDVINVADLPDAETMEGDQDTQVEKQTPPFVPVSFPPEPEDEDLPTSEPAEISEQPLTVVQPSPKPSVQFEGVFDDSLETTAVPPDSHGAVGPKHVMTATNTVIRFSDRSGKLIKTVLLDDFWSPPKIGRNNAFDPRVLYDPFHDRWLFTVCANSNSPDSALLLAASQTNDPTGSWHFYKFKADSDQFWVDFPSMGFNGTWVAVSTNMAPRRGSGNVSDSKVYVVEKAKLYAGAKKMRYHMLPGKDQPTLVPATTLDNTLQELFLVRASLGNSNGKGYLRIYKISGKPDSPTKEYVDRAEVATPWTSTPPALGNIAPQPGKGTKINVSDSRMQTVVYRNGSLWCAHTVFLPATGTVTRSAIQWWQLDPTGKVEQFGRIDDSSGTIFRAYPSLAVNKNGDVLIGYSRFSPGEFASAAYSVRAHTDPLGSLREEVVYKAGEASYDRFKDKKNRWGDYSHTVVDPKNDLDMWTIQEYARPKSGTLDRWGTWWAMVEFPT